MTDGDADTGKESTAAAPITPEEKAALKAMLNGGAAADAPAISGYDPADVGLAQRFAEQHRDQVKYGEQLGCWFIWDGKHWLRDPGDRIMEYAIKTANSLRDEKVSIDLEAQKAAFRAYVSAHKRATLRAMIDLARHMLAVDVAIFDRNPYLLNCRNGTVDLRNGKIKKHDPADLITKLIDCDFDRKARAPRFRKFMAEILPNRELRSYMQRVVGYAVTGDPREEALFVMVGPGANGKTVMMLVIRMALSDYGATGRPELLVRKNVDETNNEDIAGLCGQRLVEVSETNDKSELNEAQVKWITGKDPLKASMKYESLITFWPTHHILLRTNNKPIIKGTEYAIWRRIKLIPFLMSFLPKEKYAEKVKADPTQAKYLRIEDKSLTDALRKELPGVLAWIVEGAIQWFNRGKPNLREPKSVTAAVEEYRSDQDRLGQFIEECCERAPGEAALAKLLYARYRHWALERGWQPWADNTFGKRLSDAGFKPGHIGAERSRIGLRLKSTIETSERKRFAR